MDSKKNNGCIISMRSYVAIFLFLTFSMEKTDKKWYTIFICVKR